MQNIYEYIEQAIDKRQTHLRLDEPCIERGGPEKGGLSAYCKGLLAHVLDTTIPTGMKIHVCHACNNERCSNPNHLYWGTARENAIDRDKKHKKSIWCYTIEKYGEETARNMQSRSSSTAGRKGGQAGKGKPKSEEHKRKISESLRNRARDGTGIRTTLRT